MISVRAAVHVHSEWSYDAGWSLSAIADAFASRGCDVVLLAEHDRGFDEVRWAAYQRACASVSDERILLVPGIEYEDADNVVHTTVWGIDVRFLGGGRSTLDVLRDARREAAVAVLAHPWRRSAVCRYSREWAPLLHGVEIWNRKYDGVAANPEGMRFADREGLAPFVSLDFHTRRQFFPLAMALDLEERPSVPAVVDAVRKHRHRPEAFGVSAGRLTRGWPATAGRTAEKARRALRGPVRRLERSWRSE